MAEASTRSLLDRSRLERISDGLAVAIVVSLPWSTSASGVFIALWLLSLLPVHDFPGLRRILRTPAGALPVVLVALAVAGTLWADVNWTDRLHGINGFIKLLVIPLLMVRFSNSDRAHWVLNGFLGSVTLLLLFSTLHAYWPTMPVFTRGPRGTPIHDYIIQSSLFIIAIFVFLEMAAQAWKERRIIPGVAMLLLACAFFANILSIASGRTAFIVIPVLLVLFCLRQATLKGAVILGLAVALMVGLAWTTSPYLRWRVDSIYDEVERYRTSNELTSAGYRLEFWKNGLRMLAESPVIGHGTGSIREMYRRAIEKGQSALDAPTANPHNQALAVAIQLGGIGLVALFAMWIAHAVHFFRGSGLLGWTGFVVVVQNVVSCLFVSYLFDFTMGWFYVIMVGVLAGAVLRERTPMPRGKEPLESNRG